MNAIALRGEVRASNSLYVRIISMHQHQEFQPLDSLVWGLAPINQTPRDDQTAKCCCVHVL